MGAGLTRQRIAVRDPVSGPNLVCFHPCASPPFKKLRGEQEAYRAVSRETPIDPASRALPRVAGRTARLFPVLGVLAVLRVPGTLELAFDVVDSRPAYARRARSATRIEIRARSARRECPAGSKAASEVLAPVVALGDFVQVFPGRQTSGSDRLAAVDSPAGRRAGGDVLEEFSLSPVEPWFSASSAATASSSFRDGSRLRCRARGRRECEPCLPPSTCPCADLRTSLEQAPYPITSAFD